MAFDFPNTPTEGQKYTPVVGGPTYTYKAPVWELVTTAGIVISDIPPAAPSPGATWWESDSGASYVYYDDGNTQQWVQTNSVGLADAPVDGSSYARRNAAWINVSTQLTAQTRNRVVNGAMQISQENGDTASTTASGYYVADQWVGYHTTTATVTKQRAISFTPNGSVYRIRQTITAADAALAATDICTLRTIMEGVRVSDLKYGGATARQSVLRFGFKGPAGVYSFRLMNEAADRAYVQNFTISAGQANTDTEQVFTILPCTTGAWNVLTGIGLYLDIVFAAGTNFHGTSGVWNNAAVLGTASNTNGLATAGAVYELFDVGLYLDPANTGMPPRWETPDEAEELIACKRYWERSYTNIFSTVPAAGVNGIATWQWKTIKRVIPVISAGPGSLWSLIVDTGIDAVSASRNGAQTLIASGTVANARM